MLDRIGYYLYELGMEERLAVVQLSHRYGTSIYGEREREGILSFRVPALQNAYFESGLKERGIAYQRSDLKGLVGSLYAFVRKPSLVIGCILALALYLLLTSLVWEVRVVASGQVDEDDVLSYLEEAGLYEGAWRKRLDADAIAASYLLLDQSSAFVSIHLDGLIAYVELIPKDVAEPPDIAKQPAHIVASRDAIIEDVQVFEGVATVRVGEVVKAGQLLVSGAITTKGGTRLVAADAEVWGQVEDSVTITIPFEREVLVASKQSRIGFSLTIFGRTFTWGTEAGDYIARERMYLFGFLRMPVVFSSVYRVEQEARQTHMAPEDAASLALVYMRRAVLDQVGDGTLLKKELTGVFTKDGYILTCTIVYQTNIAKSLAFSVDN